MIQEEIKQAIEQLQQGKEESFQKLYEQTYPYVYKRACLMMRDEQEAFDLVQEVYFAVYKNIGNLQNTDSFYGWLKTIVVRQGMKMMDKNKHQVLVSEEQEEMFEEIPDEEPGAEDRMFQAEDVAAVKLCIQELSKEQQAAIFAYYYDEMKIEEIAAAAGVSEGTIKSRLYLARKNLKETILRMERKQGYQLHSFGSPVLVLALGMLLEESEISGARAEYIFQEVFRKIKQELQNPGTESWSFCRVCGKPIAKGAAFCGNCGSPIGAEVNSEAASAASGAAKSVAGFLSKTWILPIIAGICTLGTVLTGVKVMNLSKDPEKQEKQSVYAVEAVSEESAEESEPEDTRVTETEENTAEEPEKGKEENVNPEPSPELAQPSEEEKRQAEEQRETEINSRALEIYQPILEEYRKGKEEGFSGEYVWVSYFFQNDIVQPYRGEPIYYKLYDFCEDGTPELLIASYYSGDDTYAVEAVYGSDGTTPRMLLEVEGAGGGWLTYCGNEIWRRYGRSGGMSAEFYDYYRLKAGGTDVEWVDGLCHDGSWVCFRFIEEDGDQENITEDAFLGILDSYGGNEGVEIPSPWIPLEDGGLISETKGSGYNRAYLEIVKSEATAPQPFHYYYVQDLNEDGIPELLLAKGKTETDMDLLVYAYDEKEKSAYKADQFFAPQAACYDDLAGPGVVVLMQQGEQTSTITIQMEGHELVHITTDDEEEAIHRYREDIPLLTSYKITDTSVLEGDTGFFRATKSDILGARYEILDCRTEVSSSQDDFYEEELKDDRVDTVWMEGGQGFGVGEIITFSSDREQMVNALYITPGCLESQETFYNYGCPTKLTITCGDISETVDISCADGNGRDFITIGFEEPLRMKECTITIEEVREGKKYEATGISEMYLLYIG